MKHCAIQGVLLPPQRTLRDYTHYVPAIIGFSAAVDKQLLETANICECQEWEKYVALILDEMHIKEDLVFDKHTGMLWLIPVHCTGVQFVHFFLLLGALMGFINLGETNDHLLKFKRSLEEGAGPHPSTISEFHDGVYGSWPLYPTSVPLCTVFLCISVRRSTLCPILGGCMPA